MDQPNTKLVSLPSPAIEAGEKQPFVEPKLTFVQPRLTKQGEAFTITAGFFQTFSP